MMITESFLKEFTAKAKELDTEELKILGRELHKIDAPHILFDTLLDISHDAYGLDVSVDISDAWFE